MSRTIESISLAGMAIVNATDERTPRSWSSAMLAKAAGYPNAAKVTIGTGGAARTVWQVERPAEPRCIAVESALVNGVERSTTLDRAFVLAAIKLHAGDDKALAASLVARFPAHGEPATPTGEAHAMVAGQRDALFAFIAGRSWTLTKARKARKARADLV